MLHVAVLRYIRCAHVRISVRMRGKVCAWSCCSSWCLSLRASQSCACMRACVHCVFAGRLPICVVRVCMWALYKKTSYTGIYNILLCSHSSWRIYHVCVVLHYTYVEQTFYWTPGKCVDKSIHSKWKIQLLNITCLCLQYIIQKGF